MAFSRSLLIKGIAGGLGACTACAGGVGIYKSVSSSEKLTDKQLIEEAGLDCELNENELTGTDPKNCTVKADVGKINVKKGDQTEEGVSFTNEGTAKLKVSKSEERDYSNGLKFVVDSGDITLNKTGEGSLTINKLGQYETYEIKEKGGKYYLLLKDSVEKAKTKILVLPESCTLPTDEKPKDCVLNQEQIKAVNFDGKTDDSITTTADTSLKITKVTEEDPFSDGYRLTFTFPSEVTISADNSVKANTPTDFKIKKGDGNALTLEKAWKNNEFANKAGLNCNDSNACTVTTPGGTINVKNGQDKKENITGTTGPGKIKVEKDQEGYNQGLKFTISEGDVTLNGATAPNNKLEELETYEITEEGGKYYLTKKTGREGIVKTSLGLPCNLPTTSSPVDCDLDGEQAKKINFHGKEEGKPSEPLKLKISKTDDNSFPLGYKFTFSSESTEVTIADENKIKANTPTDFKIKKGNGNDLSLEKAWKNNEFTKKIGLECTGSSEVTCTKSSSSGEKLNVKVGDKKNEGITSIGNGGKIKLDKDQAGYNQGFKFTIINSPITLSGGNGDANINKLEQFETYEITEDGDKYYLTRKTGPEGDIKTSLGLPCDLPAEGTKECTVEAAQSKGVKFDQKEDQKPTVDIKLKIEKTEDSSFPFGYKFTLLSTKDVELSTSSTIKKNTDTVFKIKRKDSNNEISLEKAWTPTTLGAKVGLQSCSTNNECTLSDSGNNLKVMQDHKKETSLSKDASNSNGAKIKVYQDQEGYNQGFKFFIEGGRIGLTGSSAQNDSDKIKNLDEYETYEIKEVGGSWYLARKDKAEVFIRKQLNIGEFCTGSFPDIGESAPETCNIEDIEKLKNIKFDNKTSHTWPTETKINIQLSIERDSKNNNELKFTFTNNIPSSSQFCIPNGKGGSVNLNGNSNVGGVEYKIKKSGSGSTTSLTLEKNK